MGEGGEAQGRGGVQFPVRYCNEVSRHKRLVGGASPARRVFLDVTAIEFDAVGVEVGVHLCQFLGGHLLELVLRVGNIDIREVDVGEDVLIPYLDAEIADGLARKG